MNSCQFVVFNLGTEQYAIDISYAQEIIRIPKFTKIPNVPVFVEGVFNLRGKVIPVFDLKKRFRFNQTERGIDSRLLILEMDGMKAGIVVDDVSEVIMIDEQSLQNLNDEIVRIGKNSIEGITIINEKIIIILNALELKSEIFKYHFEKEIVS